MWHMQIEPQVKSVDNPERACSDRKGQDRWHSGKSQRAPGTHQEPVEDRVTLSGAVDVRCVKREMMS